MKHCWLALLLLFAAAPAPAHPLAPALLDLRESAGGRVEVLLKTSLTLSRELQQPLFPARCRVVDRRPPERAADARLERWRLDCGAQGLAGARIAMAGDHEYDLNVVVNIARADGSNIRTLLSPATPGFVVPARESGLHVTGRYLGLGVGHLLTGFDHLLFVLGLLLWLHGGRALPVAVSAFTLGHSVTLALATLGLARVAAAPVELGIALSILWLAIQLGGGSGREPRRSLEHALFLPFVFGLLHGLGFAGALIDVGLPDDGVPLALLGFNAGIELGQLAFIGAVALLHRGVANRVRNWAPARVASTHLIGAMSAFWIWERGWPLLFPAAGG